MTDLTTIPALLAENRKQKEEIDKLYDQIYQEEIEALKQALKEHARPDKVSWMDELNEALCERSDDLKQHSITAGDVFNRIASTGLSARQAVAAEIEAAKLMGLRRKLTDALAPGCLWSRFELDRGRFEYVITALAINGTVSVWRIKYSITERIAGKSGEDLTNAIKQASTNVAPDERSIAEGKRIAEIYEQATKQPLTTDELAEQIRDVLAPNSIGHIMYLSPEYYAWVFTAFYADATASQWLIARSAYSEIQQANAKDRQRLIDALKQSAKPIEPSAEAIAGAKNCAEHYKPTPAPQEPTPDTSIGWGPAIALGLAGAAVGALGKAGKAKRKRKQKQEQQREIS